MFRNIHFVGLILLLLLSACQSKNKAVEKLTVNDIPLLLDRHPSIQNGEEWGKIQSYYGRSRQEVLDDPKAMEPRLNLAYVFINEARITGEHGHYYPAALKMLNGILDRGDLNKDMRFRALAAKAGVQLSLHDFQNALTTGQQAVTLNPYNAQIYGALVDANVELGHYDEAVKMADKMVSIRPDLRSYSRVSYLREIYGDVDGAIEAMHMAVDAGVPGQEPSCWARLTLGHLLEQYRSADEAEQQYQEILAQRPDYPFALAALAGVKMKKDDNKEAMRLLNKAAGIIPEVSFYEQIAELQKKKGDKAAYENTMQTVFAMFADDEKHGHNMDLEYAKIYTDLDPDLNKALAYAKKELQKRPDNIDVNRRLAIVYSKLGKKNEAATFFAKASRTHSQHPELMELKQSLAAL
jgi:tetratricopeptide (TPR) repeat protein